MQFIFWKDGKGKLNKLYTDGSDFGTLNEMRVGLYYGKIGDEDEEIVIWSYFDYFLGFYTKYGANVTTKVLRGPQFEFIQGFIHFKLFSLGKFSLELVSRVTWGLLFKIDMV